MVKLVVLKFNGSLESGFDVNSEIALEGKSAERGRNASLPIALELKHCLACWQQAYQQLGNQRIIPQQIIYDGRVNPHQQIVVTAKRLRQALSTWLNSPQFQPIDKYLREELNRHEAIRISICSDSLEIGSLPWCCWDLVENYPQAEVALSNPNFARVKAVLQPRRRGKVRILAIFGDGRGIDLKTDRTFLDALTDAKVEFLVEPTLQQLDRYLWQSSWDAIFFAGHSSTKSGEGILHLNSQEQLTIEQLRSGFKQAIANGLQLAIFNSCDGLGLAEELGRLSLPQSIVMRMPIPDVMAQQFIKYFLPTYAGGKSLYLAVREAREQLQGWEQQFPCASWLPIIYQNPALVPPSWSQLKGRKALNFSFRSVSPAARLVIPAIATCVVLLIQSWGWLETGELNAYDRLMVWGFTPPVDQRMLVVTIDERDLLYQRAQDRTLNMRGSLTDSALKQLLDKLQMVGVKAIASDVIHDFPFDSQLANTVAQNDNFFAICRVKNSPKLVSIAPPPQLAAQQVGFSNWAIDRDGTIRRQIIGMSPDGVCQSGFSLGLRLALKYLGDIPTKYDGQSALQIGNASFAKLQTTSGGYRLPESRGYQILLNYRRAFPPTIPLRKILTQPQPAIANLVRDKVVMIGVVGHNHDLHDTPYSRGQQTKRLPGVMIHSLMVAQIIDMAEGKTQLRWLDDRLEILWIALWSAMGSILVMIFESSAIGLSLGTIGSLALLFICCWLMLLQGIWLLAIAPALGFILSAAISAIYRRNYRPKDCRANF